jgi:benzodiazapine receptor
MDSLSSPQEGRKPNPVSAIVFVIAILAVSMAIGYVTRPGEWYAGLDKPVFNPPGWVFGPVWTVLYVLIAIAGWRILRNPAAGRAKTVWIVQMVLNWAWSPAFFGAHMPWLAFIIIVAMLVAILAFIAAAWKPDRVSALLFLPYLAWVSFATLLNGAIAVMN